MVCRRLMGNPGQNIWHDVKKCRKFDKTSKICYLILHVFLTAIVKV